MRYVHDALGGRNSVLVSLSGQKHQLPPNRFYYDHQQDYQQDYNVYPKQGCNIYPKQDYDIYQKQDYDIYQKQDYNTCPKQDYDPYSKSYASEPDYRYPSYPGAGSSCRQQPQDHWNKLSSYGCIRDDLGSASLDQLTAEADSLHQMSTDQLRALSLVELIALSDWLEVLGAVFREAGVRSQLARISHRLADILAVVEDDGLRRRLSQAKTRLDSDLQRMLDDPQDVSTRRVYNLLLANKPRRALRLFSMTRNDDYPASEQLRLALNLLAHAALHQRSLLSIWTDKMQLDVPSRLAALAQWQYAIRGTDPRAEQQLSDPAILARIRARIDAILGRRWESHALGAEAQTACRMEHLWKERQLCPEAAQFKAMLDANPALSTAFGARLSLTSSRLDRLCGQQVDMPATEQWRYACLVDREHRTGLPQYIQQSRNLAILPYERIYSAAYYAGQCDLMDHVMPQLARAIHGDSKRQECRQQAHADGTHHYMPDQLLSLLTAGQYTEAQSLWHRMYPQLDLSDETWNIGNERVRNAASQLLVILACKHAQLLYTKTTPVKILHRPSMSVLKYNLAIAIAVDYNLPSSQGSRAGRIDNDERNVGDWLKIYALSGKRDAFERIAQRSSDAALVEGWRAAMLLCSPAGSSSLTRDSRSRQDLTQSACDAEQRYEFSIKSYPRISDAKRLAHALCHGSSANRMTPIRLRFGLSLEGRSLEHHKDVFVYFPRRSGLAKRRIVIPPTVSQSQLSYPPPSSSSFSRSRPPCCCSGVGVDEYGGLMVGLHRLQGRLDAHRHGSSQAVELSHQLTTLLNSLLRFHEYDSGHGEQQDKYRLDVLEQIKQALHRIGMTITTHEAAFYDKDHPPQEHSKHYLSIAKKLREFIDKLSVMVKKIDEHHHAKAQERHHTKEQERGQHLKEHEKHPHNKEHEKHHHDKEHEKHRHEASDTTKYPAAAAGKTSAHRHDEDREKQHALSKQQKASAAHHHHRDEDSDEDTAQHRAGSLRSTLSADSSKKASRADDYDEDDEASSRSSTASRTSSSSSSSRQRQQAEQDDDDDEESTKGGSRPSR